MYGRNQLQDGRLRREATHTAPGRIEYSRLPIRYCLDDRLGC